MRTNLPAVQKSVQRVKRYACLGPNHLRFEKRHANRLQRRALNRATARIEFDVELWWEECFDAPSLSGWDMY